MADRVLITGARAAAALDLGRDFAAAGWEVHLADCAPARIVRWSRAPSMVHRYNAPVQDAAGFQRDIAALIARIEPRLIVPACEEVFHLAAPSLAGIMAGRLFAPPLTMLRRLHDKLEFARACAGWGLLAPESHALNCGADLQPFARQAQGWVFKPRFSRFGEAALVGPDPRDLARLEITPARPWLAQRRVRGQEACFHAAARDGRLEAFSAYRSAWRLRGGASFAFEPLGPAMAEALQDCAARLAAGAGITGQFACDAMFDGAARPWLIECNPRATSGVHLIAGGGRLARAITGSGQAWCDHGGGDHGPASYLGPAMWLRGLPMALAQGRLRAWYRAVSGGDDALAVPGDRLPWLGALADAAGFALAGWRRGISATAATTADIEWNGEELR